MGKWWAWVGAACVLWAGAGRAQAAAPTVLYLNFSDGHDALVRAATDDAPANRTVMGSVVAFPAFAWPGMNDDVARRNLIDTLARQVNDAFLPFNVVITTERPPLGPYTMVVVGGTPALFSMDARVAGVAYMDCDNRQPSNVSFAFPSVLGDNTAALVTTIAQEAAHAFGLQHTSDPNDFMYPRVDLDQHAFQDREAAVASPNLCGPKTQNSYQRLMQLVGPWTGGDKPINQVPAEVDSVDPPPLTGGCSVGARRTNGAPPLALALLFALRACRRRRGRL